MKDLNPQRATFVREYCSGVSAAEAARRAGFKPKHSRKQAARLLATPTIARAIEATKRKALAKAELNAEYVLIRLQAIVERCMTAEPVTDKEGREAGEYRFDSGGANRALELLGRHLGMFVDRIAVEDCRDLSDDDIVAEIVRIRGQLGDEHAEVTGAPALPAPGDDAT